MMQRCARRQAFPKLAGFIQPVWLRHSADQTPPADDGFAFRHGVIPRVVLDRSTDEDALIARPHVVLAGRGGPVARAELPEQ
ncbi:hypothetical protein G6F22_021848 [Rhizopus arrhizus]|nr:hypothetical protein G6F22_021848 [Rhizopus arrhizus]